MSIRLVVNGCFVALVTYPGCTFPKGRWDLLQPHCDPAKGEVVKDAWMKNHLNTVYSYGRNGVHFNGHLFFFFFLFEMLQSPERF